MYRLKQLHRICLGAQCRTNINFGSTRRFAQNPKNHYEILGLKPNCTDAEVQEAFTKLAKKYQPNSIDGLDGPPDNRTDFDNVTDAHRILSDADLRAQYDAQILQPSQSDWRQPPEDPLAIKSVKVESKRFDDNISFLGMGLLAVGAVTVIANLVYKFINYDKEEVRKSKVNAADYLAKFTIGTDDAYQQHLREQKQPNREIK